MVTARFLGHDLFEEFVAYSKLLIVTMASPMCFMQCCIIENLDNVKYFQFAQVLASNF